MEAAELAFVMKLQSNWTCFGDEILWSQLPGIKGIIKILKLV